jgi:hypothetical protein
MTLHYKTSRKRATWIMILTPNRTPVPEMNIQIAGTTIERKTETRFGSSV